MSLSSRRFFEESVGGSGVVVPDCPTTTTYTNTESLARHAGQWVTRLSLDKVQEKILYEHSVFSGAYCPE